MTTLRIGVIGLGMGRHHAKTFHKHPHCRVVAVADPDVKRLAEMRDELGIKGGYEDYADMLEKESLDIVAVATPNHLHKPTTIAALQAGAHVICEKPMAMSAAEGREMAAAATECNRRLMINFSFRFTPQSWEMKKRIEEGILGDIYYGKTSWLRRRGIPGFGGWFGRKALSGGGPLIDLGVHRLDLALWFMGYPAPTWVAGATYDPIARELAKDQDKPFDVEDLAVAMIHFANGATLMLEASWAAHIRERELMETRLLGTKGGLLQRNRNEGYDFEAELFVDKDGCGYDMTPHAPIPAVGTAMDHFADCILADKPHTATPEEGIVVMQILDAIYESAARGEPVQIKP